MMRQKEIPKSFLPFLYTLLVITAVLLCTLPENASAMITPGPGAGGSSSTQHFICTDMNGNPVSGFSVAIVYCVRATIADALLGTNTSGVLNMSNGGYLQHVTAYLAPYKWAAIILAFTLFGAKLMTVSVEQLTKEASALIFKTALVLFLIDNLGGAQIYSNALGSGLYMALTDAADELVSFATNGIIHYTCSNPPAVPPGANVDAYKIWQEFDCMFMSLMDAGKDPATVATTAGASIVVILGAAMFSGAFAIFLIIMAVTLFIMVLLTLMRAIYALILSYFVLALLIVIGPLIIPLLVFDNKFTTEVFWKWLGLMSSIIFQPLFLVGFLCFAVMAETQFVDGTGTDSNGNPTVFNTCVPGDRYHIDSDHTTNDTPGSGVCSINQLLQSCVVAPKCLNHDAYTKPDGKLSPPLDCCFYTGKMFNLYFNVELKAPKVNCPGWWPANDACGALNKVMTLVTDVVNWAADKIEGVLNNLLNKIAIWIPILQFPVRQLFITFIALFLTTVVFRDLLDVIPHMAQSLSVSVGIGLLQLAQVPLESMIATAVKSGGDAMKASMGDAKGLKGMASMGKAAKDGAGGAGRAVLDRITGR